MKCFYLTIFLLCWTENVKSVYHVPSKQNFQTMDKGTLFGYSIAYQQDIKRLVISAPKEDAVGKIYECDINTKACNRFNVNITEGLTNPWLGAKVTSGKNFTLACAPRYTEMKTKHGTFGRCYVLHSIDKAVQMQVLEDNAKGINMRPYELYMDSFGWSADVDSQGHILVGGPAMSTGRAIMYNQETEAPRMLSFTTGNNWKIKYNFGYSVTSGLFYSLNKKLITYAISSPYGSSGYGLVILSDGVKAWRLDSPKQYKPPVGSLFGAAMCSAKLRGPGQREALIIGAPTYASKGVVDVGIVYIYQYDVSTRTVTHQRTVLGKNNAARFGSAIVSLGDLNGDKKDEIAIAAPYENSGKGAVYIYSAADLLRDQTSSMLKELQKIESEEYWGLGTSLAALQDFDENGCNELAIGAPDSGKVVYLTCMAKIIVNVLPLSEDKTPPFKSSRRNETYFVFQSCVNIQYPEKPKRVKSDISVKISLTHPIAKLYKAGVDESFTYNIATLKDMKTTYCKEVGIFLPLKSGYEPVIQYTVTASETNSPIKNTYFDSTHAVLSDLSVLTKTETVWVADCAGNRVCNPELVFSIYTSIKDGYIIGSTPNETVSVSVKNTGDVAYTTCAHITVEGVHVHQWSSMCQLDKFGVIICSPKVPIRKNADWSTGDIVLETAGLKSDIKNITFTVKVFPHCQDHSKILKKHLAVKLTQDSEAITLTGQTQSSNPVYLTKQEVEETGKQISHIYTVFNGAITDWVNLKCAVTLGKKNFFENVAVTIDAQTSYMCQDLILGKDNFYTTECNILELRSTRKLDVIITLNTEPGVLDAEHLKNHDETILSNLKLIFGENQLNGSVTTTLKLSQAKVPLWAIIVASLVGLLIMFIFVFALYECGFFERQNQQKLRQIKKSVHRQSMRRSANRPSSAKQPIFDDKEKLVLDQIKPKDLKEQPDTAKYNIRQSQIILGLRKNLGKGSDTSACNEQPQLKTSTSP